MLTLITVFLSFFLIGIIFLQLPDESVGLSSFATKSNILGSPRTTQRFFTFLTGIAILIYLGIAFQLNILNR